MGTRRHDDGRTGLGKTDRRSLSDTATSTGHQCDTAFEMQAACHEYFPKKSRSFNPWSEQRVGLTINLPRKIIEQL